MRTDRLCLALSVLLPGSAALAQNVPWYVALAGSYAHESNIYRLADGVSLGDRGSRADSVFITSLEAGFDQSMGRQRLRGSMSLRDSRFARNNSLDNRGHGLRLTWDWSTVDRWSGTVVAQLERSLVRFDSGGLAAVPERNIGTTRRLEARARVGLVTRWSAEFGASHQQNDYSATAYLSREFRQSEAHGSLRYAPGTAISWSLGLRALEGEFPRFAQAADGRFIADRYHGRYTDLGARYDADGVHAFDARIGLGSTRYDRATATDLSGVTGALLWSWRPYGPRGKTRLDTRLWRDRGQDSSSLGYYISREGTLAAGRVADYSRSTTGVSVAATTELTAKLSAQAMLAGDRRDLRDVRQDIFGQFGSRNGTDRSRQWSIGLRWQPTRTIAVGCSIGQERRSASNELSTNLGNDHRNCFAQVSLY